MPDRLSTGPDQALGAGAGEADRRRSPRVELLGRLNGQVVALKADVVVRDLSQTGMSIETQFSFPAGAIHEFRLSLPDGSSTQLEGRVIHGHRETRTNGPSVCISGIQFLFDDLSPAASALKTLIAKFGPPA